MKHQELKVIESKAHKFRKAINSNHFRLWTLMAVAIFLLPWFFVAMDFGSNAAAWGRTMDAFHFIFFALLAWWLLKTLQRYQMKKATLVAGLLIIAIIALIEAIQPLFGRSASIADLAIGAAGGFVSLLTCALWHHQRTLLRKASLCSLIVVSFSVAATSAVVEWYAVYWRHQQMPLLGSFETTTEMRLWHAAGYADGGASEIISIAKNVTDRSNSLRVKTHAGSWSGVWYQAGGINWSDYKYLTMAIYNPGHEFQLKVRIDDTRPSPQYGERINTSVAIKQGWNKIAISLRDAASNVRSGDFDITSIQKVVLFTSKKAPSLIFYLDDVRLK